MKQNTQTINEISGEALVLNENQQLIRDLVTAILIVSVVINLFILIGWMALQMTHSYDAQLSLFLLQR
jgi:hypothetical protein